MKHISTLLITAIILSASAFGQVELGFHAGLAWANLHEEQVMDDENIKMIAGERKPGITAGATANIPLKKNLYIQTGLNYIQKKLSLAATSEGFDYTQKVQMNVLELPVQLVYRTSNKDDLNLLLGFGPTMSYSFGGKMAINGPGIDTSLKISYGTNPDDDHMKSLEFGGNVLMGVQTRSGITIAANYNFGFSDLHPEKTEVSGEKLKFSSSYWGIRIGYVFGHKAR